MLTKNEYATPYCGKIITLRTGLILLLLSGLAFHDFLTISSLKIGMITATYLRITLILAVPCLLFPEFRLNVRDRVRTLFFIFIIYGLTRMEGNIRQTFTLYCTLLAFFVLYILIDDMMLFKKCIDFLATVMIFFCVIGEFEILSGYHFGSSYFKEFYGTSIVKMKAIGMYFNENDFSAFLAVMIFIMLLSNYRTIVKIFFISLSIAIIIFNSSTICLLGIISYALIAYVIWNKRNKDIRFWKIFLISIAVAGPVVDMIRKTSINTRTEMYRYGIKNCIAHLWLGTGIGNYGKGMLSVGFPTDSPMDPHNIYLELAGQFGIIWLILFLILLIKLMIWYYKNMDRVEGGIYFLGLLYIISFVGLSSSSCMEKNYIYLALLIPALYYRMHNVDLSKGKMLVYDNNRISARKKENQ